MKLTLQQEKEIIALFKAGYKVKRISEKMGLSYNTVEAKIKRLRKKGVEIKRWWED